MEAGLVDRLRRHQAQAAHGLDADRDAEKRGAPVRAVALARREHRRHDHGAGMHRPALERVVEILAVRRRAVDERGAGRAHRCRAWPIAVQGPSSSQAASARLHVVLVARRDAQADDVDQQVLAFLAHARRQVARDERDDALGQAFGDGTSGGES